MNAPTRSAAPPTNPPKPCHYSLQGFLLLRSGGTGIIGPAGPPCRKQPPTRRPRSGSRAPRVAPPLARSLSHPRQESRQHRDHYLRYLGQNPHHPAQEVGLRAHPATNAKVGVLVVLP